jgi:hypothetical protein
MLAVLWWTLKGVPAAAGVGEEMQHLDTDSNVKGNVVGRVVSLDDAFVAVPSPQACRG